jgi:RHS repeat-associated protein
MVLAATVKGDAAKATAFGYDTGALIVDWTAPVLSYVSDATDQIVTRKLSGVISAKYAYTASADSPSLTLNSAGTVTERTISLPGGVVVTTRGATASDVWSYPNIHGDIIATTNGAGIKAGATRGYDPFGNLLGTSTTPDNSAGPFDYGWHGSAQRPVEYSSGFTPLIEMGARQYSSLLGRFLEVDPVLGGNANDYAYVSDPVGMSDLDGLCGTFGNPFKRCGKNRKGGRGARHVYRHLNIGAGVCPVFGCLNASFRHGHLSLSGGIGLAVSPPALSSSWSRRVPQKRGGFSYNTVFGCAWYCLQRRWTGQDMRKGRNSPSAAVGMGVGYVHEWGFTF